MQRQRKTLKQNTSSKGILSLHLPCCFFCNERGMWAVIFRQSDRATNVNSVIKYQWNSTMPMWIILQSLDVIILSILVADDATINSRQNCYYAVGGKQKFTWAGWDIQSRNPRKEESQLMHGLWENKFRNTGKLVASMINQEVPVRALYVIPRYQQVC